MTTVRDNEIDRVGSTDPRPTEASRAILVLVLGILGIYPLIFLGPFAWALGNVEISAIDAGIRPGDGRRRAVIGRRLGKIGTIFWGVLFALLFLAFAGGNS